MPGCASRSRFQYSMVIAGLIALATTVAEARDARLRAEERVLAAIVLADETAETRDEAAEAIRTARGTVAHAFDGLLIVEISPDALRGLLRSPAVKDAGTEGIAASKHRRRPEGFHAGVDAWNRFFRNQAKRFSVMAPEGLAAPPREGQDSWLPPASVLPASASGLQGSSPGGRLDVVEGVCATAASTQPYGATDQNTSEFLAGSVSVNLILVQSDGTIDLSTEKWTADREQAVATQVVAGLDWLRSQEPAANLSFVYHVIAGRLDSTARTGYEPVSRKADPMGSTGEDLWVGQILTKRGYTSGDRWVRSRALANDTRREDRTDWGVNVFVVDSLADIDGRFADGYFAYSWIGGSHLVMTYDNQAWGIDRMNQVMRHEILHSFFAYDEYSGSGCTCTEHRGYLDGVNGNCRSCNAAATACVMDSNTSAMCSNTRRQIGWTDLDGDGADDVIGEDPVTVLDTPPATVCGGVLLTGQGSVVAATNRNPAGVTPKVSISVNRLSGVEWRADGGSWAPADPSDGAWGDYVEVFKATVLLSPGTYNLDLRTVDDHGNTDLTPATARVTALAGAADPGDVVTAARSPSGTASLSWAGAPSAAKYRDYRSSTAGGSLSLAVETPATTWTDTVTSSVYYRVRSVDACGNESSP